MIDFQSYSEHAKLPIGYALLDSWWYEKGKGGGVKNWTAQPSIFPDGMEYVHSVAIRQIYCLQTATPIRSTSPPRNGGTSSHG